MVRPNFRGGLLAAALVAATLVGVGVGGWLSNRATSGRQRIGPRAAAIADESAARQHAHADHAHAHAPHDEATSIELSPEAQRSIGLRLMTVELRSFDRTVTLPAMVVERPGRSRVVVTAPLTGVITRIDPLLGEAIAAGQPLFEMRLTHEELVQGQTDFLRSLEELDVVNREIERLEKIAAGGAIPGKSVLERKYEQQKLTGLIRAQQQALLLHGLHPEQVETIRQKRELLGQLTVRAPESHDPAGCAADAPCLLQVQDLDTEQGQHVTAGETLCVLSDHCELYIEGKAFAHDIPALNEAARQAWPIKALLDVGGGQAETIEGLRILLLGARVDPQSRTLPFYATLKNEVVRDETTPEGRRFVSWRFKPGQRAELQVPLETWPDRVVLPAAAVVQEGPESYVFLQNGDHFDRRAVHVEYRDRDWVVLADENEVWPGDVVAMSGAQQLQLALKNKAGAGADPHAGHSH